MQLVHRASRTLFLRRGLAAATLPSAAAVPFAAPAAPAPLSCKLHHPHTHRHVPEDSAAQQPLRTVAQSPLTCTAPYPAAAAVPPKETNWMQSYYRRELPAPSIAFSTPEGKVIFAGALADGSLESFFPLIEQFRQQPEPTFCGLTTLTTVLNALSVDPGRVWKGIWRWYDERMLDCCDPLVDVESAGIDFNRLACLARCNGLQVEDVHADEANEDTFRAAVAAASRESAEFLVVAYSRAGLGQTGDGHYAPVGGYHAGRDLVLLLDVARFKYPPHWTPLPVLWAAMCARDEATGRSRGYYSMRKAQGTRRAVLFTLACRDASWKVAMLSLAALPSVLALACSRADPVGHTVSEALSGALRTVDSPLLVPLMAVYAPERATASTTPEFGHSQAAALAALRALPLHAAVSAALARHPQDPVAIAPAVPFPLGAVAVGVADYVAAAMLAVPPPRWRTALLHVPSPGPELLALLESVLEPDLAPEVLHLREQYLALSACDTACAGCDSKAVGAACSKPPARQMPSPRARVHNFHLQPAELIGMGPAPP